MAPHFRALLASPQVITAALTAAVWSVATGNAPAAPKLDFNRDIQPILSENCYHCHGPDKAERKADLRLDQEKEAKADHDGTVSIVPGRSSDSELIKRIFSDDPDEVMPTPKSNRKLTVAQKEMLKRWIDEGAKWGVHWAFVKPVKPAGPAIQHSGFNIQNSIDAFVLSKLSEEKLTPSPEASRETLIRRVTLDLTGLPPTPEEVDAFVRDTSPQAYERVVDRLLNSPRYGERMAWDWLDSARYADTNGFQGDPERTMWPWRDWVVKAFNTDMPYDQFTVEQLAGDLLPNATLGQKLASGFHRNNMHNGEGGRIAEETRVENVFDRVETTATIWMGLTFTCCRCSTSATRGATPMWPVSNVRYTVESQAFSAVALTGQAPAAINNAAIPIRCHRVRSACRPRSTSARSMPQRPYAVGRFSDGNGTDHLALAGIDHQHFARPARADIQEAPVRRDHLGRKADRSRRGERQQARGERPADRATQRAIRPHGVGPPATS